jgi:hypothetical protein
MATAAMPEVKYDVPHTGAPEDGTARQKPQEIQAQGMSYKP